MTETETRHDLFVYETDATFTAQVERYLVAGLEADECVIVVVSAAKQHILRRALGPAADSVSFLDPGEVYARREVALATIDAAVRRSAEALDPGIRVYGELPLCGTQAEWDEWMAYEAIVNRAFADSPAALMCGYDTRVVPAEVVRRAWQTHGVVLDEVWQISREYEQPEEVVRRLTPPLVELRGLRWLPIGDDRLHERIAAELSADGVPEGRARDLVVAAREVIANAERYGNGVRGLRVGTVGESFVCEVSDAGPGLDDPLAGFVPPVPLATSGAGLWIARQLTTRLELHSDGDGLTVRLWV